MFNPPNAVNAFGGFSMDRISVFRALGIGCGLNVGDLFIKLLDKVAGAYIEADAAVLTLGIIDAG